MKIEHFKIGSTFFASAGFEWLCTDKGTRTITAIMLNPNKDSSWFTGPPYNVDEVVFDEYDMISCYADSEDILVDRIKSLGASHHPNFSSEDVSKMLKEKRAGDTYPGKNLLKRDRISSTGEILHPYAAVLKNGSYYIKTFELFSQTYSEMLESDFKNLGFSNEEALQERSEKFKAQAKNKAKP